MRQKPPAVKGNSQSTGIKVDALILLFNYFTTVSICCL